MVTDWQAQPSPYPLVADRRQGAVGKERYLQRFRESESGALSGPVHDRHGTRVSERLMEFMDTPGQTARRSISGNRRARGSYSRAECDPVILCVDDESDMLTLLRLFLSAKGFEVIAATNGAAALDLIDEHRPDLIITDCVMPGMSGLELCRTLRDRAATRDIPVILYSGRDLSDVDRNLFDRFLLKPAKLDALARAIRGLLAGSCDQGLS